MIHACAYSKELSLSLSLLLALSLSHSLILGSAAGVIDSALVGSGSQVWCARSVGNELQPRLGWPRYTETEIETEIEIEFKLNSKLKLKLKQKFKIQNKIEKISVWRLPFYARTCKVFVIDRILNNIVELFAATRNKVTINNETTTNTNRENNKAAI